MSLALNFSYRQRLKVGLENTIYSFAGTAANFIISVLIVRLFSPHLWGSFTQLLLAQALFSQLLAWGSKDYLIRAFSLEGRIVERWQTSIVSRALILIIILPVVFLSPIAEGEPVLFACWLAASFLYRSADVIVVFERRFRSGIIIETIGLLFIVIAVIGLQGKMSLHTLTAIFLLSIVLKAMLAGVLFRVPFIQSFQGKMSFGFLLQSLPYCLPSIVGYLQAKGDTFAIALRLPRQELGAYYVLINLLSYCHAIPLMAITPFVQNMYRMNPSSLRKMQFNFLLWGSAWSIPCIFGIWFLMNQLYSIALQPFDYFLAWLALPPYFLYFLPMQRLIRQNKPYTIVWLNLAAALLNFGASNLLITNFGFSGGLMACASMQWFLLTGFLLLARPNHSKKPA